MQIGPLTPNTDLLVRQVGDSGCLYRGALDVTRDFIPSKTLAGYLDDMADSLADLLPQMRFIAQECTLFTDGRMYDPMATPLTRCRLLAIVVYTFDLRRNPEDNFYYQFNVMLRERNNQKMAPWRPFLYFLFDALKALPSVGRIGNMVTVYRGHPDVQTIRTKYLEGRTIHWSGFTSTSNLVETAKRFAGRGGVVMRIRIASGRNITEYSFFPTEDEVLLSPNVRLVVNSVLQYSNEDDIYYIDLIENTPADPFVF